MADDQTAGNEATAAPAPAPAAPPSAGSGNGAKVGGWILVSLGGLLVIAGIALVVIHLTQRENGGYYTSSAVQVGAPGYAVTTEGLDIGDLPGPVTDAIGRVRVNVRSNNGQALFVGIGHRSDVSAYLGGVRRSEVTDVNGDNITYKLHSGGPPAGPPARQSFWQASSSGTGQITVTWKVKGGTWAIVLMNANGAAPVSATVSVGANTNLVLWVGIGLLVLGLILGGAGTGLLLSSNRSARPDAA
jgi:hypothetical protein